MSKLKLTSTLGAVALIGGTIISIHPTGSANSVAGGASSALAADSKSIPSTSVTSSTVTEVTEVPNVKIIEEGDDQTVVIGKHPRAVILETYGASFPTGQASLNFSYKPPVSGTEKVRIFVQNNSAKTLNYKLVAPSGAAWIGGFTIAPGKSITTEHIFGASQKGTWVMYFDTNDGSAISVDAKVRDGL